MVFNNSFLKMLGFLVAEGIWGIVGIIKIGKKIKDFKRGLGFGVWGLGRTFPSFGTCTIK